MKTAKAWMSLAMATTMCLFAPAATTMFRGVSVDYGSASTNWVDGELVLTYKGDSQLEIKDGAVMADIFAVGGGGAGGTGANSTTSTAKKGDGGNGGEVVQRGCLLAQGSKLTIAVGAGGQVNTTAASQGKSGGKTTVSSTDVAFEAIEAAGGTGGTAKSSTSSAGTPASGTVVDGTEYGKGGAKAPSSGESAAGDPNTGAGGQGGRAYTNSKYRNGGAGGSGVVIVRLREAIELLKDLDLRVGETVSEFRDASGDPVSFAYSDVTCSSSIDLVASVVETADGKVGIVGHLAGRAQITIVAEEKTYLLDVTVDPLITGKIRVGAYEVDVQNASRTNWVDGELVITYLDTNESVEKSFTLPKDTTGRLLAVGGGGAGGQDEKRAGTKSSPTGGYDEKYGLPGGGGAGGLIVNDVQDFAAEAYTVTVGAGGAAVGREFVNAYVPDYQQNMNVWRPTSYGPGANGSDTVVRQGTTVIATAKGGGGGGRRSVGNAGGSGGGGSYSGGSKNGGSGTSGQGNAGGKGGNAKYGAGGGGAGGLGGNTSNDAAYGSGAGGPGKTCDITGENLEYACGGAGGVPRVYQYYYEDKGQVKYTDTKPSVKYFWCEAEDGKPGRDGYGDGGGGSGHYGTNPTFAGRGGNGAVIVRIPPYKTTIEDALKAAFADQPVTVSGSSVTLNGDVACPIGIPDNLGAVTVNLNGHSIIGANGAEGDDITPGGDGQPALAVVAHTYASEANAATEISVTGAGSLKGGDGGKGYPGGAGAPVLSADGFTVTVAGGIAVTAGTAGESYVQHPHKWAYTVKDNKIVAYCVAEDGVPCSYRDQSRGPFVAVSAADAAYTAMRYDELTAVNGITPVTGIVIAPETYAGRDGTDYPESSTPPREQGAYTVSMQLGDLRITSDFTITEPKPSQGSVYQAWKTAERKGRDVQIVLSATFDGSKAINDGNVLFLGSRCSAHSMANGTVESSVNALTRYANVRWYAYGSSDPDKNLVNRLTRKGETLSAGTVPLVGGNHFVHKEMMDDLYAELVEKKNLDTGYDLIILEFDGDLLCREGFAPYQLNYRLPEEWTDEKAAGLRAAMSRYYAEDRVVWIVPDVNQPKEDAGYTGEYPWTSNPDFIWQRAFLNATETEGYRCPLQKNYEDTDALIAYLQEVLVGHFFSNAIIKDTLANGLTIKKVTPQMRSDGGIWRNFEGGPSRYTIPEPRSGTTVTADVETEGRQVEVTFDMREEQAWACEQNQVIGDDFRVVIDAELDDFFSVGEGEWQETNEGPATFTFTESNLDDDEEGFTITIEKDSPKIQNVKLTPDYTAEDVVKTYDGIGTNIVVKPIAPEPEDAIIRYSLDEHGTYAENLALTNVCEKTKVWFEITDRNGEFTTVTNFACVTILPRPEPEVESMGLVITPVEAYYNKDPQNISFTVTNAAGEVITPDPEKTKIYYKGPDDADWVPADEFAGISNVTKAAGSSDSNGIVTVAVKVSIEGYEDAISSSTVRVMPRVVAEQSGSAEKPYDGTPLTCSDHSPDPQTATNLAYEIYHEVKHPEIYDGPPRDDWADAIGFADGEGLDSVPMTSSQTDVGSTPNVVDVEHVTFIEGTKADNYALRFPTGTLTVTDATMGIAAFPAEKFYDAEPTNIAWVVTNATGAVISDATITLREKGTTEWIPATEFVQYVDTTNVTVEAKAEKTGFTSVTAEATVLVKPRPVTLVAGSDSKTYDGTPLTCDDFAVKADETTPGYGFVKEEGVASVTMTPASTVTNPGSVPNVIASETAKEGTKLERNYTVRTEPGTLTVTDATMCIAAFPAEKFYDAEPTNIAWVVTNATGAAITPDKVYLRETGTGPWIPAAEFARYVDTTNVTVEVKAEKSGFTPVTAEATVLVKPRPVTLVAGSDSKTYDGTPLTCDDFAVKADAGEPGYGFVPGEGVGSVTMTPESTVTLPGSVPNVIASETAKEGTKLERNYTVRTEPGTLTVTDATMGIAAFPAEKFYDAEPTNIAWVVTNATGAAITPDKVYLRETGTGPWIPAAEFARYVDTTNVTVQVRAEKAGFTAVEAEATVLVKPRPVTLVAGSASKTYDGTPLTCDDFTVKADTTTPGYGFVKEEGVASVTMTAESTVTDPGSVPNEIASETAKEGTKLERNYVVSTEPGTLTVTAATMGIEAFPAEKFYDAEPTNVTWVVTNAAGAVIADATISLREKGTGPWIPAADFLLYVDTTNVTVEVKAEKSGFASVEAEATVVVKPRPVTLVAGSAEKVYDGTPLTCDDFTVKADETTSGYGFVKDEGVASVTMTDGSTVTDPGSVPNEIATETAKEGTKLDRNYVVTTEPGTLTVTAASMGIEAFDAEKFYDADPTNVTWVVTNAAGAVIADATISLREKGTGPWIPAADFLLYVDTTNVTVEVKAEKSGFAPVEAEATVVVKPRPVTLVAGSAEKVYDGTPLTCDDFTVKADETTPGYGFVKEEGVASVTMTDGSTITDPGSVPNEIATETAKEGTKLDRNYVVTTEPGELKVTTSGALTVEAFPAEKFYDAEPTNVTWTVKVGGEPVDDATVYLREKGTETWVEAKDFVPYLNATNWNGAGVEVEVKATKDGYSEATAESTVLVKPRIVVSHAKNASKNYDGTPLRQPEYFEDEEDEAARSKAKWGTDEALPDSIGFVDGEGFAADLVMTEDSQQTLVGEHPNVIDQAADKTALKPNTRPENYEIYYLPGSLIVVDADPYVDEYDAKEHSITVNVPVIPGVDPSEVTVTYSWDFGGPYTSLEALPWTDVVTGKTVWYKVEVPGYPDVYGSSTIDITPIPVHIVSNDDFKYFDGEPLTNWTGVATITTNGVTTTFDVGTEVPLVGDDKIVISYTGTQTEVGNSPNSFGYAFVEPEKAKNYVVTTEEGELEVIQREEEVQRDEDFEELPEETKEAIKEADKKVNEILEKFTEADQANSGEPFVKYQLTVTKKDDLTEKDRTVPAVAAVDAVAQVDEIEEKTGKTPDKSEYVDIILERTYDKEEATNREEKGKDGYDKEKWDQLDEAKDHNDIILSVMFPYEVPDGMELLGVTRSCHPDNNYDPDDATHGLLTAVPKVPEGQQPTQEGFYYDPETKTITLYAKDFCLFGFHLREIPAPPPVKPCNPCCEESSSCKTPCVYAYEFILLARSTEGKAVTKTAPKACVCEAEKICGSKCYRKPCMRKYAGFVVGKVGSGTGSGCRSGCGCLDFVQPEGERGEIPDEFVWGGQLFWDVRTKKAVDAALWFTQLDAIGYWSRETVEAVGQFAVRSTLADEDGKTTTGFVRLAGFGTRGRRGNGQIMVRSLSGFFAGQLPVGCTNCSKSSPCADESCAGEWALPWTICSDVEYPPDEDPNAGLTAAYGKWTLKWNDTAAARLTRSYQSKELVKPGYDPSIARETTLR